MFRAGLSVNPHAGNVVLQDFCHLAVTSCVLLPLEDSLRSVLAVNALDETCPERGGTSWGVCINLLGGAENPVFFRDEALLRSSRMGSSAPLQGLGSSRLIWMLSFLPYLRRTLEGLGRVLDWLGGCFLQVNIRLPA